MNEAPQIAPRGLCAVRIYECCDVRHNHNIDLCGTGIRCADRLNPFDNANHLKRKRLIPVPHRNKT